MSPTPYHSLIYILTIHAFRINALDYDGNGNERNQQRQQRQQQHDGTPFHEKYPILQLKLFLNQYHDHDENVTSPAATTTNYSPSGSSRGNTSSSSQQQQHHQLLFQTTPVQFSHESGYYTYTWNQITQFQRDREQIVASYANGVSNANNSSTSTSGTTTQPDGPLRVELWAPDTGTLLAQSNIKLEDKISRGGGGGRFSSSASTSPQHKRIPLHLLEGQIFGLLSLTVSCEMVMEPTASAGTPKHHQSTQSDEIIIAQHHNLQDFQNSYANGERPTSTTAAHSSTSSQPIPSSSSSANEFYSNKDTTHHQFSNKNPIPPSSRYYQSESKTSHSHTTPKQQQPVKNPFAEDSPSKDKDLLIQRLHSELENKMQMEEKLKQIKENQQHIIAEFENRNKDLQHQLTLERARSDRLERRSKQSQSKQLHTKLSEVRQQLIAMRQEKDSLRSAMRTRMRDFEQHFQHCIEHQIAPSMEALSQSQNNENAAEQTISSLTESLQEARAKNEEKTRLLQQSQEKLTASEEEIKKLHSLLLVQKKESEERSSSLNEIEQRMDDIIEQTKKDNIHFMQQMEEKEKQLRAYEENLRQRELTLQKREEAVENVSSWSSGPTQQKEDTEQDAESSSNNPTPTNQQHNTALAQREAQLVEKEKIIAHQQQQVEATVQSLQEQQQQFEKEHQEIASLLSEKMQEVEQFSTDLDEKEQLLEKQFTLLQTKLQQVHEKEQQLAAAQTQDSTQDEQKNASLKQLMEFSEKLEALQTHLTQKDETLSAEEARLKEMESKILKMTDALKEEYALLEERAQSLNQREQQVSENMSQKETTIEENIKQYEETRASILQQAEDLQKREEKFLREQQQLLEERSTIRTELEKQLSMMEAKEQQLSEKEEQLKSMAVNVGQMMQEASKQIRSSEESPQECSTASAQTESDQCLLLTRDELDARLAEARNVEESKTIELLEEEVHDITERYSNQLHERDETIRELKTQLQRVVEDEVSLRHVHTQYELVREEGASHETDTALTDPMHQEEDMTHKSPPSQLDDVLFAPASESESDQEEEPVNISYLSNSHENENENEYEYEDSEAATTTTTTQDNRQGLNRRDSAAHPERRDNSPEMQQQQDSPQSSSQHASSVFNDSIERLVTKTQVLKMRVHDHYDEEADRDGDSQLMKRDLHLIMRTLEDLTHEFSQQKDMILEEKSRLLEQMQQHQEDTLSRIESQLLSRGLNHSPHRVGEEISGGGSGYHASNGAHDQSNRGLHQSAKRNLFSDPHIRHSTVSTPPQALMRRGDTSNIISPLMLSRGLTFSPDDNDDLWKENIESPTKKHRHSFDASPKWTRSTSTGAQLSRINQSSDSIQSAASRSKQRMLDKTRKMYLKKKLQFDLLSSPPLTRRG